MGQMKTKEFTTGYVREYLSIFVTKIVAPTSGRTRKKQYVAA